jgi:hypothetical protein
MDENDYVEDPLEEKLSSWGNQLRTLTHAYMDRPPTEYVVDKYFATHSLNIIYGAPATMKSMVMADLCGCIVAGNDWLRGVNGDNTGIPTQQGAVLWLDMDNGQRRTDQRLTRSAPRANFRQTPRYTTCQCRTRRFICPTNWQSVRSSAWPATSSRRK